MQTAFRRISGWWAILIFMTTNWSAGILTDLELKSLQEKVHLLPIWNAPFFLDILLILVALRVGESVESALSALAHLQPFLSANNAYFNNF